MRHILRITSTAVVLSLAVFSMTATVQGRDGVGSGSLLTGVGVDSTSTYLPKSSPEASYCVEVGGILYCW